MSLFKKKNSPHWWVDFTLPSGQRVRRSSGTKEKKQALIFHDRLKSELWNEQQLGQVPSFLFEDAALMLLKVSDGQKDYDTKIRHIRFWRNVFKRRPLSSITTQEILNALPTLRKFKYKSPITLSNATKNRYLATLNRLFSLAYQAQWIERKPYIPFFKEPKVNVRWITKQEAARLLQAIHLPWLHDVCLFALMTGARANEIFTLTWDKVDLDRKTAWLTADLTKSGRSRVLPLNDDALRLLYARPHISNYVFCRDSGIRIQEIDRRAFHRAATEAGLEKLKFHDLRHTWASWHVQDGTPLMVLKELGGWERVEMVQKYAHLAQSHLANYAINSQITAH